MAITATASGTALTASLRSQIQTEFASAKKTYQETGSVADVSENYTSADGNVTISLSGRTDDGQESLELKYSIGGAEGSTLAQYQTGGIDDETGLPFSADTRLGGPSGDAGNIINSADDIDAFEQDATQTMLETQDEGDAKVTGWGIGDNKYVSSREEYRAYNRVEKSAWALADKITDKIDFKSDQDRTDFYIKLGKAIALQVHNGGTLDLSGLLKDVPTDQLEKAAKALTSLSGTNPGAKQLIKSLNDYIDDRKSQEAPKGTSGKQALNLVV